MGLQTLPAGDCLRLAELSGCGLLRGSYIPAQDLKDLRDLARYRTLCRCRHKARYAEARIMPGSRGRCRRRVVASRECSA
jgi:hypothetical protein